MPASRTASGAEVPAPLAAKFTPDDQRDDERGAEHRAHESDRLGHHVDQAELLAPQPFVADFLLLICHLESPFSSGRAMRFR